MAREIPEGQKAFARGLRSEMTRAETMIWRALRGSQLDGLKFRRQVPLGPYIADFVCFEARLVVELDGPPHEKPEQRERDARRDAWFRENRFLVLRFSNDLAIGGTDLLLDQIRATLRPVLKTNYSPRGSPSSDPR